MRDTVHLKGHGIHGGSSATVTLHARPGPVSFERAGRSIPPREASVVSTRGCIVLGDGPARVAVVEHLLAALQVRGVWEGLVVACDADELPILDGSAAPWADALDALGPLPASPAPIAYHATVTGHDDAYASLRPGPTRVVCAEVDYAHPAIGRQRWCGDETRWHELLPARTFGFARDASRLRAAGLATGVHDGNAIVFDRGGPRVPLRASDEPVRHKALDALGDLYLLGHPFAGTLHVRRGTHALHRQLVATARTSLAHQDTAP